jgi:hypothetical protein
LSIWLAEVIVLSVTRNCSSIDASSSMVGDELLLVGRVSCVWISVAVVAQVEGWADEVVVWSKEAK